VRRDIYIIKKRLLNLVRPRAESLHVASGPYTRRLPARAVEPPGLRDAAPPVANMQNGVVLVVLVRVGRADEAVGRGGEEGFTWEGSRMCVPVDEMHGGNVIGVR
jgi:hypothetical protein